MPPGASGFGQRFHLVKYRQWIKSTFLVGGMNIGGVENPSESLLGCLPTHAELLPYALPAQIRLTGGCDCKLQKLGYFLSAAGCQIDEVQIGVGLVFKASRKGWVN